MHRATIKLFLSCNLVMTFEINTRWRVRKTHHKQQWLPGWSRGSTPGGIWWRWGPWGPRWRWGRAAGDVEAPSNGCSPCPPCQSSTWWLLWWSSPLGCCRLPAILWGTKEVVSFHRSLYHLIIYIMWYFMVLFYMFIFMFSHCSKYCTYCNALCLGTGK